MLETTRLKLVPLTHEQLLLYKNNPEILAKNLGVNFMQRQTDPAVAGDLSDALEYWITQAQANRDLFRWHTNWEIVLKDANVGIGGVGFTGAPGEEGKSTLGYGLDMRYYGKGYATEAVGALTAWGFLHHGLKAIVAETLVANFPSQRVLVKNGFRETRRDDHLICWSLSRSG